MTPSVFVYGREKYIALSTERRVSKDKDNCDENDVYVVNDNGDSTIIAILLMISKGIIIGPNEDNGID